MIGGLGVCSWDILIKRVGNKISIFVTRGTVKTWTQEKREHIFMGTRNLSK